MSTTKYDNYLQKETITDLAVSGGKPAFEHGLHVGRPNIGDRAKFAQRVDDILDRRWLTNGGQYVEEFERRIAELVQVEHCVAMCNATAGLEIAIRALDLSGEVIVPSFTFVATANALQWLGVTPVFCDVDPQTHLLDPSRVEQLVTPLTSGIIGVHLWGRPSDIKGLAEIANRRGLKLLFDAAHAFGSSYQGRLIGSFGDAEIFSFHATKFLNSLEGGAITTNDADLARKFRLMRNFGFSTYDKTDSIGINGKMNEISAAMGLTNLESMDEFIAINRRNYKEYKEHLDGLEGMSLLSYDENESSNYQYVVLEVDEAKSGISRDELLTVLHAENVLVRRYFYPGCHRMEPYRTLYADVQFSLSQTEYLAERVLTLPTGQTITPEIIRVVCGIIRTTLKNAAGVRKLLDMRVTGVTV